MTFLPPTVVNYRFKYTTKKKNAPAVVNYRGACVLIFRFSRYAPFALLFLLFFFLVFFLSHKSNEYVFLFNFVNLHFDLDVMAIDSYMTHPTHPIAFIFSGISILKLLPISQ